MYTAVDLCRTDIFLVLSDGVIIYDYETQVDLVTFVPPRSSLSPVRLAYIVQIEKVKVSPCTRFKLSIVLGQVT